MTSYHVDVEFAAYGHTRLDSYDLLATSRNGADAEVATLLQASPERHYDRTVTLFANESTVVAVWIEKAVAQ